MDTYFFLQLGVSVAIFFAGIKLLATVKHSSFSEELKNIFKLSK